MGSEESLVECSFLIPLVRNSTRLPHRPLCWQLLEDGLYTQFGGSQGPEEMGRATLFPDRIYRALRPTGGEYRSGEEERVSDQSWRYIVAVPQTELNELRAFLRRAANTFDQECIYLSIKGEVEFVEPADDDSGLE